MPPSRHSSARAKSICYHFSPFIFEGVLASVDGSVGSLVSVLPLLAVAQPPRIAPQRSGPLELAQHQLAGSVAESPPSSHQQLPAPHGNAGTCMACSYAQQEMGKKQLQGERIESRHHHMCQKLKLRDHFLR